MAVDGCRGNPVPVLPAHLLPMQERSRAKRNTISATCTHSFFAALDWFFRFGAANGFFVSYGVTVRFVDAVTELDP